MKRMRTFSIVVVGIIIIGLALLSCSHNVTHDYYNDLPDHWTKISTGYFDDDIFHTYQRALRGDYYGDGDLVTITNFHHGHVGIFKETDSAGTWVRTPVAYCFDPANTTGIPVKGVFSINTDNDEHPEILTAADEVRFGPMGGNQLSWTGPIFIDLNEGPEPVIQILLWGKWGENVTGYAPIMKPIQIDPHFRNPANLVPDIMLNLIPPSGGRLVILEQPPEGFASVNYTFDSEGGIGVYPYEEEPFYVKHMYERESGSGNISELLWDATEVIGSDGVYLEGMPFDADGDADMDLVVAGTYWKEGLSLQSRISVYKRLPHATYTYLFEEIFTETFPNSHFWGIGGHLDCDGDPLNGEESVAFEFYNSHIPSQRTRPTGPAILKRSGDLFRLDFVEVPEEIEYPYIAVYSHMGIHDWNSDGYDDIVVLTNEVLSPVIYGDLNLWLNTGDFAGHSFRYDEDHCLGLLANHGISWGVSEVQMDDDAVPEISVCSVIREHYWDSIQGGKFAYGMDVSDYLTHTQD